MIENLDSFINGYFIGGIAMVISGILFGIIPLVFFWIAPALLLAWVFIVKFLNYGI
jgi:hypothetical protein